MTRIAAPATLETTLPIITGVEATGLESVVESVVEEVVPVDATPAPEAVPLPPAMNAPLSVPVADGSDDEIGE